MIKIIILEILGQAPRTQLNNGSFDKSKKWINSKILKIILKIRTVFKLSKNLLKENKMILTAKIFHIQTSFPEIKMFFTINLIIQIKSTTTEKKRIIKINFILVKISNLLKKINSIETTIITTNSTNNLWTLKMSKTL